MSESKHTPGPWSVYDGQWGDHSEGEGGGFQIIMGPYDGGVIRSISLINYAEGHYPGDAGYPEAEANAHLIVAAPELLEALKLARNALVTSAAVMGDFDAAQSPFIRDFDALIAKAEGRS